MRWGTRATIHFDRVGSAWLIKRFVDPQAEFIFVTGTDEPDADVELFSMPGARLAMQDEKDSTFGRILKAYSISDAALDLMGQVFMDTVQYVVRDPTHAGLSKREPHVLGLLALTEGVMLRCSTDAQCLEASLPLFDAFYARLQAQVVIEAILPSPPAAPYEQTLGLVQTVTALRADHITFSPAAFAAALQRLS